METFNSENQIKTKQNGIKNHNQEDPNTKKLIRTNNGVRSSQACDRCRIKKVKCDGLNPCHNCKKAQMECKTSDKLTRRAFPKGYTESLEKKIKTLENEILLLQQGQQLSNQNHNNHNNENNSSNLISTPSNNSIKDSIQNPTPIPTTTTSNDKVIFQSTNQSVQINNPIDQIFNLDNKGIIIGNDNLNFESQFNHLLINLNLPFLKITNSHNYLLNDPDSYLYNPSYTKSNQFHNKDLDLVYNPLTRTGSPDNLNELPLDVYDLFIKLINNFKKILKSKKELDNQITQYFLNYNIFIPIFDYDQFMTNYDEFHTMYPFIFTYDDSTINGFNLSNSNDYFIVNKFLMTIIQIYAMIIMNNPTINLNLLLNHSDPQYSISRDMSIINSLYDFLPYFNGFQISINQLQTYLLLLYYSLLTNNKEKSLILSSLINAFIGILGINLNSKNLFFNDLALNVQQRRNRVKIFWNFKVLLKCFNLKFGFKPSLNTTVINPVTIDRYFQLTPEKLSSLLGENDDLFNTLLKPSIEFLNLMNIVIPSSFSPNYYQYLKNDKKKKEKDHQHSHHRLDWILNEDDGDGNDGNLNYNFNQFLTIEKNLSDWRQSLKSKILSLTPFCTNMGLPNILNINHNNLYHDMNNEQHIPQEVMIPFYQTGLPDIYMASQLIKIQLNFHYILIRSMNYLNFIVDKDLNFIYYKEIAIIAQEVLQYFLLIFDHVGKSQEKINSPTINSNSIVMGSLGLDVDEDGFVINDFSVKRRKSNIKQNPIKRIKKEIPISPFNSMLNGLSLTVINLKKSIILQMLYLLIVQMKFIKRNDILSNINVSVSNLIKSVDLFISIFINYKPGLNNNSNLSDDEIYKKLINDELKFEILKYQQQQQTPIESDDEEENSQNYYKNIDWDNENLDEDLKYLKICKFIKYKSQSILKQYQSIQNQNNGNGNGFVNSSIQQQQQSQQPYTQQQSQQHQQQPYTQEQSQQQQSQQSHQLQHPPQQQPQNQFPLQYQQHQHHFTTPSNNEFTIHNNKPDKDFGAAHDLMDLKNNFSQRKSISNQSPNSTNNTFIG
ncbi:uncharacterized protein KGF55_000760 [Candida pseudojiufengensis]|uniref:uncharacterized protein n=1 Tax=Candida pseudojiufengensis TaxID=497109 RepID=UPI0022250BCF|nr:uncharacterized protein KGF55_000760 [Candida pseudojiufengensis]KAI5966451.1 hypothetical protein KGF55_000760 [Candida pseudojiufengensis]